MAVFQMMHFKHLSTVSFIAVRYLCGAIVVHTLMSFPHQKSFFPDFFFSFLANTDTLLPILKCANITLTHQHGVC